MSPRHSVCVGLGLLVLLLACEPRSAPPTPPSTETDSGIRFEPNAPEPPQPPDLGPCAEGETRIEHDDGPATCEPWPLGARPQCPSAEVPIAGGTCAPVGAQCGSRVDPQEGTTVVDVDATASPGGVGSQEAPFTRLDEALAMHPRDATIRLGAGTYAGPLLLGSGITL